MITLVPGMGIMPTLVGKLSETKILRPILLILHALCQEALCISALAQIPTSIIALKVCFQPWFGYVFNKMYSRDVSMMMQYVE